MQLRQKDPSSQSSLTTTTTTSTTTTTVTKTKKVSNTNDSLTSNQCLCPLCHQIYQTTCHRPIGEMSCGHTICYQCFVLNTNQFGCVQCKPEVEFKVNQQLLSQPNLEHIKSQEKLSLSESIHSNSSNYEDHIREVFHRRFHLSDVSFIGLCRNFIHRSLDLVSSKSMGSHYCCSSTS